MTGFVMKHEVNGVKLPDGMMELIMKELQTVKRRYLHFAHDPKKTEGTRQANQLKVDRLDETTAFLAYATGINNPTPRDAKRFVSSSSTAS